MWAQRVRHRVDTVGDARDERLAWPDMQARPVSRGHTCGTRAERGEGGTGDAGGEPEQAREEGAGPCEHWPSSVRRDGPRAGVGPRREGEEEEADWAAGPRERKWAAGKEWVGLVWVLGFLYFFSSFLSPFPFLFLFLFKLNFFNSNSNLNSNPMHSTK